MNNKLSFRLWLSFIIIGLSGQFAWSIENMYLNLYLYNEICQDTTYIALMVALSAITATLTAFFMGIFSDYIKKRRVIISSCYILWGFSTILFGYIDNSLFKTPVYAAWAVIILDCIMTFFGSSGNDAAFNAYVTDNTSNDNRAKVEAVLSTFSLLSMLIIFGLFDPLTKSGKWKSFFFIFGAINIVVGVLSIFLLDKKERVEKGDEKLFKGVIRLFTKDEIVRNKSRYYDLLALLILSSSFQIFLPYLIIYIDNYLLYHNYAIMLFIVLLGSSIISIICGKYIDKKGKINSSIVATIVMFVGLILLYKTRSYLLVTISALVMMSGYLISFSSLNASLRDNTPIKLKGSFQGIRMLFSVAIPMVVGPAIGSNVIKNSSSTYVELGVVKDVPNENIFLFGALLLLPLLALLIYRTKEDKKNG